MNPIFNKIGKSIYAPNVTNPVEKKDDNFDFWKIIDDLNWTDKSEGIMDIDRIINTIRFNTVNIQKLRNEFTAKYDLVYNKIIDHDRISDDKILSNDIALNDIKSFISHIIGKGKNFYDLILDSPITSKYILTENEYQNLYICVYTV